MPVEIKELDIRALVTEDPKEGEETPATPENDEQQALIEVCVRKVLKILKQSSER